MQKTMTLIVVASRVASSLASNASAPVQVPWCNNTNGTAVNNNICVCGDPAYFCDSTRPYCVSSNDAGSLCYWQSMDSTFEQTRDPFAAMKIAIAAFIFILLSPFVVLCFVAACCRCCSKKKKDTKPHVQESNEHETKMRESFPGLFSRDELKHKHSISNGSKKEDVDELELEPTPPVTIEMTRVNLPTLTPGKERTKSVPNRKSSTDDNDTAVVNINSSCIVDNENENSPEYMPKPEAIFYSSFGETKKLTSAQKESYIGFQMLLPNGFVGHTATSLDLQGLMLKNQHLKNIVH